MVTVKLLFDKNEQIQITNFFRVSLKKNGDKVMTTVKMTRESVLSGSKLLDLKKGDKLELVAEWNSLSKKMNEATLYFGGQLLS